MSVLPVGFGSALGGYQIERSLRFNSADSAYLNRTLTTPTDGKRWTWSGWVKRGILTAETGTAQMLFSAGSALAFFRFSTTDTLVSGWTGASNLETTQVFRDPSSWYHIMLVVDTTQATASNRVKYYVNGSQITAFATTDYPTQNSTTTINSAVAHNIGAYQSNSQYFNGYMTEVNFIDGQALTPSDFGETDSATGVWKPKAYTGTYGTNGFFLKFADNSGTTSTTLGKDSSGNSNNWTPNNFSVTAGVGNDSLVDSPTAYGTDTGVGGEVRGNYATLNPLQDSATLANGNLDATSLSSYSGRKATMQLPTTGKWYWETTVSNTSTTAGNWFLFGMVTNSFTLTSATAGAANAISFGDRNDSVSGVFNETSTVFQSASINFATSDILQCAYDADSGKFWFGKNNSWYDSSGTTTGAPATGSNQTLTAAAKDWFPFFQGNNTSSAANMNFGQRAFAYTAPSGFKALCTTNLPTPTIGATSTTQANKYFNVVTFSGNGSQASVTGVGFQPEFIWAKNRTNAYNHELWDAVRGVNSTLFSNATSAEDTTANRLVSFNSDGFTYGTSSNLYVNATNSVAWCWDAAGSNATNTSGTITSTVRANTTSGFSIVTYTGTSTTGTIGHGLGVAPSMIIVKARSVAADWAIYHVGLPNNTYSIYFDTGGQNNAVNNWNSTSPTSSVFTVIGTSGYVNTSPRTYVAYCFAPVAGYSAFGKYTGNGAADGPFVYLGFRPKYILLKRTDTSFEQWWIHDSVRGTYNAIGPWVYANLSNAEQTGNRIDFLSNGFKLRGAFDSHNGSGGTYVYACFAESPFKYSLAR